MVLTKGADSATKGSVPVVGWPKAKKEVTPTIPLMDIEGAELEFFREADLKGIRTIVVELYLHIYHRPGMREIREGILVKKGSSKTVMRLVADFLCSALPNWILQLTNAPSDG